MQSELTLGNFMVSCAKSWRQLSATESSRHWKRLFFCWQYRSYNFQIKFIFYIHGSVHRESNLITFQQDATYSVYYISVGSSTCFGCWHPSSGARTTVITASGIDWLHLLPSALVVKLELNNESSNLTMRADGSRSSQSIPEAVITVVRAPDDGC